MVMCAAGGYALTLGWFGDARQPDSGAPREFPADSAAAGPSPQVRRLPPVEVTYPTIRQSVAGAVHHDPFLRQTTYLMPLAAATVGQTPTIGTPEITGVKKEDDSDLAARDDGIWYYNKPTVKIVGSLTTPLPEGHAVGLSRENERIGKDSSIVGNTWEIEVEKLNKGPNLFRVCVFPDDGSRNWRPAKGAKWSGPKTVKFSAERPYVVDIDTNPLLFGLTPDKVRVFFSTAKLDNVGQKDNYALTAVRDGSNSAATGRAEFVKASKMVVLPISAMTPGLYKLTINDQENIRDWYGNLLRSNTADNKKYETEIYKPVGADVPSVRPGITGHTGPQIDYQEFTPPRNVPDGFNPSDHVETRVARLYYYRDAHRVVQIINRTARSYNRAAVDMQRQLADKARATADEATAARQQAERNAIIAAQKTRQAEYELAATEQRLTEVLQETDQQRRQKRQEEEETDGESQITDDDIKLLQDVAASLAARARGLREKVENLRNEENELNSLVQELDGREQRAREEQFRREVAAGHADPDTYAPGDPESDDPVRQVSVSVIGEGLIQLRGPIKGINIIRKMINQIDAPVGQVRINVHTVQVNGEHGDRMERVVDTIQKYIDHSRFLTAQSAEMLRRAVVKVASQRAMEAMEPDAAGSQQIRDQRYLYAFFGRDFIDELRAMDSEFLKTGNKLLSLHSMDTTSLSSALFLMALANNSTRQQILKEFQQMLTTELPAAERSYFEAGTYVPRKHQWWCEREKFQILAHNARFESFRGFFHNQAPCADDIMTPIQREFIRLAQIFKARLITEMEYNQRVMERALIEERGGDYRKELQDARRNEKKAEALVAATQKGMRDRQVDLIKQASFMAARAVAAKRRAGEFLAYIREHLELRNSIQEATDKAVQKAVKKRVDGLKADADKLSANLKRQGHEVLSEILARSFKEGSEALAAPVRHQDPRAALSIFETKLRSQQLIGFEDSLVDVANRAFAQLNIDTKIPSRKDPILGTVVYGGRSIGVTISPDGKRATVMPGQKDAQPLLRDAKNFVFTGTALARSTLEELESQYVFRARNQSMIQVARNLLKDIADSPESAVDLNNVQRVARVLTIVRELTQVALAKADGIATGFRQVAASIADEEFNANAVYNTWVSLREEIFRSTKGELKKQAIELAAATDDGFAKLLDKYTQLQFALKHAEDSRRPLDHKKFLDMFIDDLEDKYIELLEGTRAQTANIDNYIKRITTALENDFNTQFYYPAFRAVREASRYWDVNLGQIETTGILANNRSFAKVSPQATMEFDLPKRDILIAEAMNGAKAMINDFGALVTDPSFLALAAMGSGQPTSSLAPGAGGGLGSVRNVLPGLDSDTAAEVLSQSGPGQAKLGAALEALIPDPAIYKFETGTGFEIRPVIQPDGQAVVFHFNYMYTTNVREPVRADEKHLGRVKRHFIDTDVQLSNYELREVSRYQVALKASRTSRGVPLLEDIPLAGVLFRPLPQQESSLQENLILAQATIYPTLFDLMGLRWARAIADLDPLRLSNEEFIVRNRRRVLQNRVYDYASSKVDEFLRIPEADRRPDLYRTQETIPALHPNGYQGPGLDLRDSNLQEGFQPQRANPPQRFIPGESAEGAPFLPRHKGFGIPEGTYIQRYPIDVVEESEPASGRLPARLRPGKSLPQVPLAPRGNASLPEVIPTPKGTSPKASHSGNSNDSN